MTKQDIKDTKTTADKSFAIDFLSIKDLELVVPEKDVSRSYAVWIRALLQNWRQGTVGCKGRADVARSTRKPWKQKGTGRARAGSAKSPLWRGGGVIFGPQARTRTLKITKRTKFEVMRALIATYADNNKIISLNLQLEDNKPSTKVGFAALQNIGVTGKKVSIFLQRDDYASWLSLRNLSNVQVISFDSLNAYDISNSDYLVVLKKDFSNFKDMVAQWN
ncbi:50S ribosomal protein L4 [Candidatus Chromulinivorax destructor]|uniref:Large ribosomal subunit protein uL4 n=1 Tax=Candidatus Chromulinivorax destructor TaxID=2066483 RepID=A0A345ZB00_9BACT|nr:50S ribosomal protein L4 [Candidatus Chromulinivorax destructor]AXK60467.1 50S ribosomal protein L4 [Candidatus Chromulinivorax destructor]